MKWLKQLLGLTSESGPPEGSSRLVTVHNPLIIQSPRIGFLNLIGSAAQTVIEEDKVALGPLFASIEQSEDTPPKCDVLMVYCDLQINGHIANYAGGLRDIIRESKAPIVIVASENDAKSYTAAAKSTGYGRANLVMTLERKGAAFTKFFIALFTRMFRGKTMPLAWVELAPQNPRATHDDCPGTIFAAEVSHIVFK
jgi:hypothetical protein